jgi:hypothetical protein
MITRKLAHQLINRCQIILGRMDLALMESDQIVRQMHLQKAKDEVKSLVGQLREAIRDKEKSE